ncbi:large ribosomal subunit protein bL35m-like [Tubulanus polymorphus]|uniref:large ribosomal subunit protein bL35m-like n=1 Tax=Tubulanus polymorphus TaxID=672921 RepID=UPI003DA6C5BF
MAGICRFLLQKASGLARPFLPTASTQSLTTILQSQNLMTASTSKQSLLLQVKMAPQLELSRSRVTCSIRNGKPKTVHAVVNRFYRLQSGNWIRPMTGRKKKLWKKFESTRVNLRNHVFTNAKQSHTHDKMVCHFWKKQRYFPDDIYERYQYRTNFPLGKVKTPKFLP